MNITVCVSGPAVSERELADAVRDAMLRWQARPVAAKRALITCAAVKRSGERCRCRFYARAGSKFCRFHDRKVG